MLKVRYFDTNKSHKMWWDDLDCGDKMSIGEATLRDMLLHINHNFITNLINNDKYFFIIHTGEDFFETDFEANMLSWNTNWPNYAPYSDKICVVFVSAGNLKVDVGDIPHDSHYLYKIPLTSDNKDRVKREFEEAIARLESGEKIVFKEEMSPDYAVAMRIMFLACMKNNDMAAKCNELSPDFWNQANAERPEINNLPTDWKTFIEMSADAKQSIDKSLQEWIRSHMSNASSGVSAKQ